MPTTLTIIVGASGKVYEVSGNQVVEITDPQKIKDAQAKSETVDGIDCDSALSGAQKGTPGIMFTFVRLP